jgi:hypothetical protein
VIATSIRPDRLAPPKSKSRSPAEPASTEPAGAERHRLAGPDGGINLSWHQLAINEDFGFGGLGEAAGSVTLFPP